MDEANDYPRMSATYSPEDNKIRLSAFSRLPKPLYERVRAGSVQARTRGSHYCNVPPRSSRVVPCSCPFAEGSMEGIQMHGTSYVYITSPQGDGFNLYTVGFYDPADKWQPESDHDKSEDAADRVHYLNGGNL